MSDLSGGAEAPAESVAAPELPLDTPNPVATEATGHPEPDAKPEGKPEPKAEVKTEPAKPISTREALQKAAAKVEKDNKAVEAKPAAEKPAVKAEAPVRDETGKFAPKAGDKPAEAKPADAAKPSYTADEPPARFSADAKKEWATAPESVRAEVSRMTRELTQGFEKHRAAAERDDSLREFHDMAAKGGTDVKSALTKYVSMENQLRADLPKGLDIICQQAGTSLKEVAAHILGKTPEENQSSQDATIRELRQELASVKQQVGNVSQTFEQQRTEAAMRDVTKFAQENTRFEELADDIAFFMKAGRAKDLSEAYKLAERLNPAPAKVTDPAASSAAIIDLTAQTEKGQKSIAGSPSSGSNPAARQPSPTIKESLRRAMAQAG